MPATDLGRYVRVNSRKKGPPLVTFELPERFRPEGFPYSHHLPLAGSPAQLDTAAGRELIRHDAEALLARAKALKSGLGPTVAKPRVEPWVQLANFYLDSEQFKGHESPTQKSYGNVVNVIVQALSGLDGYDPVTIPQSKVERFLKLYDHSLDQKRRALSVMKKLLDLAVLEMGRPPYLALTTKLGTPKRLIGPLWSQEDIDILSEEFAARGLDAIGAIILTGWEIGQRITDMIGFKSGIDWRDGVFAFDQSKTNAPVVIPSPRLCALLNDRAVDGEHLYLNPYTSQPYRQNVLSAAFKRVVDTLPDYKDRGLTLCHLRHSCILEFARAGCTVPEIASITGHTLPSVHKTLMHYLGRDSILAWNAVEKRERMRAGVIQGHAWQVRPEPMLALAGPA